MTATTTATRHPRHMPLLWPGCPTTEAQKTRTKPFLPLDSTLPRCNAPAECPVCGKHCSCRTIVVMRTVNAHGVTRSQMLWKFNFRWQPGTARNTAGTTAHQLSGDESERRHADRTSATDYAAQAAAIPMQSLLGVVRPKSRTQTSSPTLPQAGPLRVTKEASSGI
ncbi:hypothetical protein TcCL_ESM10944 [Trypanosoma cruzi]|nr:hypothetical protein TcCL_ESM10944 [Trypanosoma cruzi]